MKASSPPPDWRDFQGTIASLSGFREHRFDFVAVTGSTNDDLKKDWTSSVPRPRVLVAGHQEAGRGQASRSWRDHPGNSLLCSFSWSFPVLEMELFAVGIPLMMGIALHRAVSAIGTPAHPLWLKWPNDLLAGEGKLAGVLIESSTDGPLVRVVIGFGLNIDRTPGPSHGEDPGFFAPISLRDLGLFETPSRLLPRILSEWANLAADPQDPALAEEFIRCGGPMWERCWILELPSGEKVRGRASGLASQGFLRFRSDSGVTQVVVSAPHLRPG